MKRNNLPPWATGPGEILQHGLELLDKDSDTNRQLAIISIDNAVELMLKTYLGLPKRITKLTITRKEYAEISETFPRLLDAAEKYALEKIRGISLGEIEWYHRLRNQLYHEGNGLTVEREKAEVYGELAKLLFKSLFDIDLAVTNNKMHLLGEFMAEWFKLEAGVMESASYLLGIQKPKSFVHAVEVIDNEEVVPKSAMKELAELRKLRNAIVHGHVNFEEVITPTLLERVRYLAGYFPRIDD